MSRHAGPGDSFILIHALVNWFDREPRIVLKAALQWDPAVDVLLNRLPNRFISPGRTGTAIAGAADRRPGHRPGRQRRLRDLPGGRQLHPAPPGHARSPGCAPAAWTTWRYAREKLRNVLPPKPGGLLAAIDAAPDAGVIFVAHTGLDRMITVGDVWRELPMDKQLIMRFWSVPPEEVPAGEEERIAWLYDWWARIDAWIEENRPAPRPLSTDWTARRPPGTPGGL